MFPKYNPSAGNALFLVLIGVALFAALSYIVIQSNRSGGANTSTERNSLLAAEIIQYATAMESAVMRLRVANDCADNMINFENPINNVRSYQKYENPNAPADKTCNVFDKAGGGMPVEATPAEALTPCCTGDVQPGEYGYQRFTGIPLAELDNQSISDLWMLVPSLRKEVCIELNNKLGVENPGGNPPQVAGTCFSTHHEFKGTYGNDDVTWCGIEEKPSACVWDDSWDGTYYYYHVLLRR